MSTDFVRPALIKDTATHYCPGCGHGILHRLVAECLDERNLAGTTIAIAPVGCSVLMYDYINVDYVEVAHGRAPAVATGIKKARPDNFILCYQGDGDLASIGMGEIVHAANRGISMSVVFVNNAIYGMTGGQMAPTSIPGQRTTTTQSGRSSDIDGYPVRMSELLSSIEGVRYIERTKINTPQDIRTTKRAILKAFDCQIHQQGFAMVEVLSMCPTSWRMDPVKALDFIDDMEKTFPLGIFKDTL